MPTPRHRVGSRLFIALSVAAGTVAPLPGDVVHNDDTIVIGSLNVGFDAVVNRGFGFDTAIFSENNLRLYFEDTSNSASFPTNDWRIVINDSSNGGGNYFAIEDSTAGRQPFRVEAGARANALYVEADGDIGVGTNNPAVDVHVQTGNTPTYRLGQDGTSGFATQTWDLAGNETNFFIRDATNGSTLPFRIRPGAPTSTIDVSGSGNVGIGGEASPDSKMHVRVVAPAGEDPGKHIYLGPHDSDPEFDATFNVQGDAFISETLEIGSSRTRKERIRELSLDEALGALEQLQPVEFHYKQDPESQLGFIAEDVPEIVATEGRRSVRPMDFVAVLAKVVQEHQRRERELSETIGSQQREIDRLAERLEALEEASLPDATADRTPGR